MKQMKTKNLILEHYTKVIEREMDGVTVRVWRPFTMKKLPAFGMLSEMAHRRNTYDMYNDQKIHWWTGNPDMGAWDAQTVICYNRKTKSVDIYFAAIIVAGASMQAEQFYETHMGLPWQDRLILMWDSRVFDERNDYHPLENPHYDVKKLYKEENAIDDIEED